MIITMFANSWDKLKYVLETASAREFVDIGSMVIDRVELGPERCIGCSWI